MASEVEICNAALSKIGISGKQITLYGYLDKGARDAGAQPMMATQVSITEDDYVADQNRDGDYAAIKVLDEWKDAEDA